MANENDENPKMHLINLELLLSLDEEELVLEADFFLNEGDGSGSAIELKKDNLVIDGANHTINARGQGPIFKVTGDNITIKNLTIKNAHVENCSGAAIVNSGNLNLFNVSFIDNKCCASQRFETFGGGAIYNENSLNVFDCCFMGNEAYAENSSSLSIGGAIYNRQKISISNSRFISNRCTNVNSPMDTGGGAIGNHSDLSVISSCFLENESCDLTDSDNCSGGAIYNSHNLEILDGCIFKGNRSVNGGAISNLNDVKIEGSTFSSNRSLRGGALFNRYDVEIRNSKFLENRSQDEGGAIYSRGKLSVCDGTFEMNLANQSNDIRRSPEQMTILKNVVLANSNVNAAVTGIANISNDNIEIDGCRFIATDISESINIGDGYSITEYLNGEIIGSVAETEINQPKLLRLPDHGRLIVVPDVYGNIDDYMTYLSLWDEADPDFHIAFLGNIIYSLQGEDRSVEILDDMIERSRNSTNFHCILASHELSQIIDEDIHFEGVNLKRSFENRVAREYSPDKMSDYIDFLKGLPYFIQTSNGIFISNGGPSKSIMTAEEFNNIHNDYSMLWDFLWSNYRSNSRYNLTRPRNDYGTEDVENFLKLVGSSYMIRSQESIESHEIFSKQLNMSSNLDNEKRTYLDIDLSEGIGSIDELAGHLKSVRPIRFEEEDEEIPAAENTNENVRGFRYMQDLICSGMKEIILDFDITMDDEERQQFPDGIRLDEDNITIDANRHIIDANGGNRIFEVYGRNIEIRNAIITNADIKAAIHNKGYLKIRDCIIAENRGYNGAVENYGGMLHIINSKIHDNESNHGGPIYNSNSGEVHIANSSIFNNRTHFNGGAICNHGHLEINDCRFWDNEAGWKGGAISHEGTHLKIEDSYFYNNISKSSASYVGGGAVSIDTKIKTASIRNCSFSDNSSKSHGGAIYNKYGKTDISNCSFTANRSKTGGAAIDIWIGNVEIHDAEFLQNINETPILVNSDALRIYNSTFKNNESKCILLNSDQRNPNLAIFGGKFADNHAEAVIGNCGKYCVIERTAFESPSSPNSKNIYNKTRLTFKSPKIMDSGKTILNDGYILIKNGQYDLKAKIEGEGKVKMEGEIPFKQYDFGYLDRKIRKSPTNEIMLDHDITFEEYEIDYYEGGIELETDNLVIDGNGKSIDGGGKSRIFSITGKNITLKNIIFKNGQSHRNYDSPYGNNGGAIKINRKSDLKLVNCRFVQNASEDKGGAIYNRGKATLIDSILTDNSSKEFGGAIHNDGAMTITDCELSYNYMNGSMGIGGAIYSSSDLTVCDTKLSSNKASYSGGAIYNRGKLTIKNSNLTDNSCRDGGGAIDNRDGNISIINSELTGNRANSGGAIHFLRGYLTIERSCISENASKYNGGAIYSSSSHLRIENSLINTNSSKNNGGAINFEDGELNISNCTLSNNNAEYDGGALDSYNGKIKIINSILSNNNAEKSGGSLCTNAGDLYIFRTALSSNRANNGGAMMISNQDLKIESSQISDNSSYGKGGAIHQTSGSIFLQNTTIQKNRSNEDGGALNIEKTEIKIMKCILKGNYSKEKGGALYINACGSLIHSSELYDNTAGDIGGAIRSFDCELKLEECIFHDNLPEDIKKSNY